MLRATAGNRSQDDNDQKERGAYLQQQRTGNKGDTQRSGNDQIWSAVHGHNEILLWCKK